MNLSKSKIVTILVLTSLIFFIPIISKLSIDIEEFKSKEEIEKCKKRIKATAPPCKWDFDFKTKKFKKCNEKQQKKYDKIVDNASLFECTDPYFFLPGRDPKVSEWISKRLEKRKKVMQKAYNDAIGPGIFSNDKKTVKDFNKILLNQAFELRSNNASASGDGNSDMDNQQPEMEEPSSNDAKEDVEKEDDVDDEEDDVDDEEE